MLTNFDPNRPTELHTDASRTNGLGYMLMQKENDAWKMVSCGSRFISDTERRYSMVELELLGVVWALQKNSVYLLGMKNFQVVVDHKPLQSIIDKKSLNEIETPRLQRLKEKLTRFGNFTTVWRQGKNHIMADSLSRSPVDQPQSQDIFE